MVQKKPVPPKQAQARRPKKSGLFKRFILFPLLFLLVIGLLGGLGLVAGYLYINEDLPKINSLMDYRPAIISKVFADDGRVIAEFFKERRIVVPLSEVSPTLVNAFVAAEDSRFFKHQGFDLVSIVRAFIKNLEAGAIKQGGSTITQQVTRSFLLTPERSYIRKIKELILSYRIEKAFTKEEILFLYLNQIYLGHGAYGVEAAADNYFGKRVKDLSLAECAVLAGLPQAPSRYSPFRHPDQARQRQVYVLNRMVEEGTITGEQAAEALNVKLDIKPRRNIYIEEIPYFTEHVRRYVETKYGTDALYTQGLQITTGVSIKFQKAAEEELVKGLLELDKRYGYRGPLRSIRPDEIEVFAREVQAELDKKPLEAGATARGVVTQVNDAGKTATVRVGSQQGSHRSGGHGLGAQAQPRCGPLRGQAQAARRGAQGGRRHSGEGQGEAQRSQGERLAPCPRAGPPRAGRPAVPRDRDRRRAKAYGGPAPFTERQRGTAPFDPRRYAGPPSSLSIYAAALDRKFKYPSKVYTLASSLLFDSAVVFEEQEVGPDLEAEELQGDLLRADTDARGPGPVAQPGDDQDPAGHRCRLHDRL